MEVETVTAEQPTSKRFLEANEVGLGLAEIAGPKFNVTLEVKQKAAKRIHALYKADIVLWVQENMGSRVGMAEIICALQSGTAYSWDEIWDNWFDDPEIVADQTYVSHMLKAFSVCMASTDHYNELAAAHEAAQKKAAKQDA